MALAACAAIPPPPAGAQTASAPALPPTGRAVQRAESLTGEAGRDLVRGLLATLADRVVEVRRAWSGPGYYLHGFDLWERPAATVHPGLCSVRVHRLNLTDLTPDARHNPDAALNPGARVESAGSELRFRAIGPVTAGEAQRPVDAAACAGLNSGSGYFRAGGESEAYAALQAFESIQSFLRIPAGQNGRFITIECTSFEQPCADPRGALGALRAENITIVRRAPCESGPEQCWQFNVQPPREAAWTLSVKSLGRTARVVLEQVQPPVV